jgi:hypothetical protein
MCNGGTGLVFFRNIAGCRNSRAVIDLWDLVKSRPTGAGGLMMVVSLIGCSQSHQTTAIQHENFGEHAAPGDRRAQ